MSNKVDTAFLASMSPATLTAWLRQASKEVLRLNSELIASIEARNALASELARRNREKVGIPSPSKNCGNCQLWAQDGKKMWGTCPKADEHGLFGGSRRTETCPEHRPFPALSDPQWIEITLDDPRQ